MKGRYIDKQEENLKNKMMIQVYQMKEVQRREEKMMEDGGQIMKMKY